MDKYRLILGCLQDRHRSPDLSISGPPRLIQRRVEVPQSSSAHVALFDAGQVIVCTQVHYCLNTEISQTLEAVLFWLGATKEPAVYLVKLWQLFIGVSPRENNHGCEQ